MPELKTDLRPMFSYSFLPIVVTFIICLILFFLIYIPKKKKPLQIIKPPVDDLEKIKKKYLRELNELLNNFNNKTFNNRLSYQKLSKIIRNFIYEVTNIKVINYTLEDIEKLNIPCLAKLIKDFYNPEFSIISEGDLKKAIEKTKEVILKWN